MNERIKSVNVFGYETFIRLFAHRPIRLILGRLPATFAYLALTHKERKSHKP